MARMIPHYQHLPAVQLRLGAFLSSILDLSYIQEDAALYAELSEAFALLEPTLLQWAISDNDDQAQMAQSILLYTGKDASEQFFLQEWQDTSNSSSCRGYAAFSLSNFYFLREQSEKILHTYSVAIANEANEFVRFVMAAQLVLLTGAEAQDAWLMELLAALANQDVLDQDFDDMVPFVGEFDNVQEYILAVFGKSRPDFLENNISPIIDELTAMPALKQVNYLRIIADAIFPDENALKDITPIRRKVLLAAADIVAQHPGFINLLEVLRTYGLPQEAYQLRQLAG
ncbi:hypothetical protein ACE38W_14400 [Chitinophaga sp. Hz27]|uniref:hypothetical protein n=1 Tax=Chitinophaga sp. Hz27 TaxID=3347169 RepID=UPI0035E17ED2